MKSGFLKRLLDRAEKIDKQSIVDYMKEIAQERDLLVLIFDSMIEGMIVVDEEEKVVFINPTARDILELGDGTNTPDLPLNKLLAQPDLLHLCKEGMRRQEPLLDHEYELNLPQSKRYLHVNIIPLYNRSSYIGTLFLFIDETEHKDREKKLLEAEKLAALATLTAGMSHEIRNPLNSLSIHLQLLRRHLKKKNIEDEKINEELAIFDNEIKRLNNVVESFLKSVRPSASEKKLFHLYSLVTETLTLMKPEFLENEIQITLHEEGEWPCIKGDQTQLKQALINIIRNSIEAITSQNPEEREWKKDKIDIHMVRERDEVTLEITDTGKGIDPKSLPHIFEPYFTNKASGTGLGLMIVERIIREHQGKISAHSEEGEGTRISITLPVAAESPRLLKNASQHENV